MSTADHVVVVGGGVGGLAVAARLAHAGRPVTVLEQAPTVGGKLGLLAEDGYRFDTGPSLVTMPWTLEETLAACGVRLADVLDLQRLDPIARYRFGDGTWLDADADEATFLARLEAEVHPGAGVQWQALMDRAARIWAASGEAVLQRPLRGPADLLRLARPADLAAVAPHRTLRSLAWEYLSDPRLRTMVDRYATYSGSDPRRAPAALATVPWAERRWGGWYVRGGLRGIAEVLAETVTSAGGTVRTGARVRSVAVADGQVCGVALADGTRVAAGTVVLNADAGQVAASLLPRGVGAGLRRRLRVAGRSLAGYVLLLGVAEGALAGAAHHTVLFPRDYDAEFDAVFGRPGAYSADPTVYVSAPDDPLVAPPGRRAVFVLVNAPRSDQVAVPPPGYGDHVLDLMAARGMDLRGAVDWRRELTPADLAAATLTPGGAIYGTSSNGPLAAFLRPPNVTGVPGLYMVGGSAHPGGGLPLVLLSAAIVARELIATS